MLLRNYLLKGTKSIYIGEPGYLSHNFQGQVSKETYSRPSEATRMNWIKSYATQIDHAQGSQWGQLLKSISEGLVVPGIQRARSKVVNWKATFNP